MTGVTELKSVRMRTADGERVLLTLDALPAGTDGRPTVRVGATQSRMTDAASAATAKTDWRRRLTDLAALLEADGPSPCRTRALEPSAGRTRGPHRETHAKIRTHALPNLYTRGMAEVSITTPRGVRLAGTFERGSAAGTAVLFAHGFLSDRHSASRFDVLAQAYRAAGHATLQIDFSGCGASEDDVVRVAGEVEDLRSASAWLTEQGYPVQAVHAHSFGTLAALNAQPRDVVTMVMTGALTGPMTYPWEQIFSAAQLDELEEHGITRVLDDNAAGVREFDVISRETLADYSLIDQADLLGKVRVPVLLLYGGVDEESTELVDLGREGLHLLPAGSRLEVVPGAEHGLKDRIDVVAERGVAWFAESLTALTEPGTSDR